MSAHNSEKAPPEKKSPRPLARSKGHALLCEPVHQQPTGTGQALESDSRARLIIQAITGTAAFLSV